MADDRVIGDWFGRVAELDGRLTAAVLQLHATDSETLTTARRTFEEIADELRGLTGPTLTCEKARRRLYEACRSLATAARYKAGGSSKWRHAFAGGDGSHRRYEELVERLTTEVE